MEREELREATLAGVRWMAIARVAVEAILLVSTVILARLLTPAEFGRAAVALIAGSLALAVTRESFGAPLVQRKELDRTHLESAFLLSVSLGAGLAVLTLASASFVAEPLFGEATAGLVRLASPLFLLAGINAVPYAILQRRLDFQRLSRIEMVSRATGAAAAIALALTGLNPEALVLGAVIGAVASTVQAVLAAPPPRPRADRRAIREIGSFGLPAAMSGLVRQTNRNIDYAILGAQMAASQVGLYWRAFQFGVEYQSKISSIMLRVAFPVYSRTRDIAEMRRLRSRIVRAHATLLFPLQAGLIAVAPLLLPWLLGAPWEPAVLPTQILSVAGMTAIVMTGLGPLLLALGKPKALLWWNVGSLLPYAAMIYLLAPVGLIQVCVGVVLLRIVTLLIAHAFLFKRLAGIPMRRLWSDAGPAAVSSAALLAVSFPLVRWLSELGTPVPIALAATGVAGLLTYAIALRLLFFDAWSDVMLLARRVLPQRRRSAPAPSSLAETPAVGR